MTTYYMILPASAKLVTVRFCSGDILVCGWWTRLRLVGTVLTKREAVANSNLHWTPVARTTSNTNVGHAMRSEFCENGGDVFISNNGLAIEYEYFVRDVQKKLVGCTTWISGGRYFFEAWTPCIQTLVELYCTRIIISHEC